MGILAVLLAAAAGFAVGAVWYMTLGKIWMAAVGKTEDEIKSDKNPLPFIVAIVGNILVAGMMRHVFATSDVSGFGDGLVGGLGVGLFLAAPWILTNYAFAGRPRPLWWIDAGHAVLATTAIGAVLGLFSA
jgi:dipeptide/tripeptide permease